MSTATQELLQAFEALEPSDRQEFTIEVMRRTRDLPIDSGPLTDEDIADAGRLLFAHLDAEELRETSTE